MKSSGTGGLLSRSSLFNNEISSKRMIGFDSGRPTVVGQGHVAITQSDVNLSSPINMKEGLRISCVEPFVKMKEPPTTLASST